MDKNMQYEFTVEKNDKIDQGIFDTPEDAYESAMACACKGISSCLSDYEATVNLASPRITISFEDELPPMSLSDCEKLIFGVFCDSEGQLYQEFTKVLSKSI